MSQPLEHDNLAVHRACNAYIAAKAGGNQHAIETTMNQFLAVIGSASLEELEAFMRYQQPDIANVLSGKAFV